jgi:hypothetical protein
VNRRTRRYGAISNASTQIHDPFELEFRVPVTSILSMGRRASAVPAAGRLASTPRPSIITTSPHRIPDVRLRMIVSSGPMMC